MSNFVLKPAKHICPYCNIIYRYKTALNYHMQKCKKIYRSKSREGNLGSND